MCIVCIVCIGGIACIMCIGGIVCIGGIGGIGGIGDIVCIGGIECITIQLYMKYKTLTTNLLSFNPMSCKNDPELRPWPMAGV